jgi:hypothetical protein
MPGRMHPRPLIASVACLVCMLVAGCDAGPAQPRLAGLLLDPQLDETSGLAMSHVHRSTLWLIEDGGNGAALHAISRRGRRLASYRIEGAANTDWEDLASFDWQGRHYLLIADTGDNGGLRRTLLLHAIEEPAQLTDGGMLRPAWSIAFRWPDGARDCEAVAVDATRGQILLVSKKRRPPELFTLPLAPRRGVEIARRIGRLSVPDLSAEGTLARQVTAADVSPDGRTLAVLTYARLLLYRRTGNEPWSAAVARPPTAQPLPWLHQAEAVAWASDGRGLYASGEFSPAPLVYLPAAP